MLQFIIASFVYPILCIPRSLRAGPVIRYSPIFRIIQFLTIQSILLFIIAYLDLIGLLIWTPMALKILPTRCNSHLILLLPNSIHKVFTLQGTSFEFIFYRILICRTHMTIIKRGLLWNHASAIVLAEAMRERLVLDMPQFSD